MRHYFKELNEIKLPYVGNEQRIWYHVLFIFPLQNGSRTCTLLSTDRNQ